MIQQDEFKARRFPSVSLVAKQRESLLFLSPVEEQE